MIENVRDAPVVAALASCGAVAPKPVEAAQEVETRFTEFIPLRVSRAG